VPSTSAVGLAVHVDDPIAERGLSFSPDGRTLMAVALGAARAELYAIDVARRRARRLELWTGPTPAPPIGFEAVAYSPDGRRVAVTHDMEASDGSGLPRTAQLLMLDPVDGHVEWQQRYPLVHGQDDPHVAFMASGTLLTSGQQGDTLLWDPHTGRIIRRFELGGLPAMAPDGHTVALGRNSPDAGGQSSAITLLDLRTGRRRTLLATLPDYWVRSLSFTPDGTELAGAATDGMHVWDPSTGKIVESYPAQAGPRSLATLDPSGDTLIAGQQDGSIAAYDLAGARRLGQSFSWSSPAKGCGYTPCMVISPRSDLMAADQANGTVALVDLRTHRTLRTLPARGGATSAAIAFTPDGRTMVSGGVNRRVTFWDAATGRVTRTLRFADPVWWVAVSPDGKLLAVQTSPADESSNRVVLVRLATGKLQQSHPLPHGPSGVVFSPDGRELFALGCCWAGSASSFTACDAHTGRQLFRLGDRVGAQAFGVAARFSATGGRYRRRGLGRARRSQRQADRAVHTGRRWRDRTDRVLP
jgi:WD40 repeat protein